MKLNRVLANNRSCCTKFFILLTGVYIGLTISNWLRGSYEYGARKPCVNIVRRTLSRGTIFARPRRISDELDTKELIFAGIMTAEKFLDSRASVVYKTWGKMASGKVEFFAGNKTGKWSSRSLPVVSLPNVDDRYPPQRKSLMMLKYMYDNHIDNYEWFMRCDDDVYVRTDKLKEFLRGFDSSEDIFLGQAGQGLPGERGKLGLGPNDNFCMGGPGMIMSRSVLKKLGPHLEYCLQNFVSSHEDVEVGRCVRKHVGVACIWAFETQSIFYHNQSKTNAFHWDLDTKAVQNAITLHPIKKPAYMYRIHAHFLSQKILAVQHRSTTKTSSLRNLKKLTEATLSRGEIASMKSKKDMNRGIPLNTTLPWELFSPKKLYTPTTSPFLPVDYAIKKCFNSVLRRTLAKINTEAKKIIYRELMLSKVNLGYTRIAPTRGMQYIFDFRMVMYQHIGFNRRKLPINVQYQAHVQQSFGNLIYTSRSVDRTSLPYVNIILPLAGRFKAFERFLSNFERTVLLTNEKVRLLIMYFPNVSGAYDHKRILKTYTDKHNNFEVLWQTVDGDFSRGRALQLGLAHFQPESLLFFCDVDLAFDAEFLTRCRLNAVKGKRIYYPIVFSQFNQSISLSKRHRESSGHAKREDETQYENLQMDRGFWRKYGFGIVCVYGEDITSVGGFDLNIKGWGLEDVRLYEQFLASGRYDITRTPDPGLVHLYHVSECSPDLEPNKLRSCRNSALSQIANAGSLVNYLTKKGYLL
ncbi:chondroitin sulfate synthase 1-like [Dendronephthya gigantea]|uniref:chondroitin sulfate synthase 1-like n=1 Tax=Dendronephthya gigantea TaxID=151771 RepID=UPI00106D01DF|nr:chondroitin sulfate synthase 1-like [Dendronephthya gigantea]